MNDFEKRIFSIPDFQRLNRIARHIREESSGDASLASKWAEGSGPFALSTIEELCQPIAEAFAGEIKPLIAKLIEEYQASGTPSIEMIEERIATELEVPRL